MHPDTLIPTHADVQRIAAYAVACEDARRDDLPHALTARIREVLVPQPRDRFGVIA